MASPRPGRMPYKNQIVIVIEDKDLGEGTLGLDAHYEVPPDFDYGPQTPAEEVAALMMTFAHRNVLGEHKTGAVLLPEEWGASDFASLNKK